AEKGGECGIGGRHVSAAAVLAVAILGGEENGTENAIRKRTGNAGLTRFDSSQGGHVGVKFCRQALVGEHAPVGGKVLEPCTIGSLGDIHRANERGNNCLDRNFCLAFVPKIHFV